MDSVSQEVQVVRNQLGHYWGKSKAWVDGRDPRGVARVKHRDEGVNLLFELSAKDVDLRGEVIAVPVTERGEPVLEVSSIPLPATDAESAGDRPANTASTDSRIGNRTNDDAVKANDSTTHPE